MRDFSTQSARPGVEREELEFDVLFVGAGPSNLAGLWRLLDQIEAHNARPGVKKLEGLTLGLIEKGDEIGDHAFSGAVLDPIFLKDLCPDFMAEGFPSEGEVTKEEVWAFSDRGGFQFPVPPPFLQNHGNHIVSLSKMVRWMAEKIEARSVDGVDVMLLPGFAGMSVLWEDQPDGSKKVVGVQTADKGVNADGTKRSNFEPGNLLKAKVTVFGEGPRGHLARELESVLNLQATAMNPQVYEMGVKEVWEVAEGAIEPGMVIHTTGWPQAEGESGGSWVYSMGGKQVSIGYVVSLDTKDPFVDAHLMLQKFKQHPRIAPILKGGKMVQYGGKAIAIGGWHSMPKLAFAGGMLVGDSAQMVNAARLKGIHLGMKGGMVAAEVILKALVEDDFSDASLMRYSQLYMDSLAGRELYKARNFHGAVEHGLDIPAMTKIGATMIGDDGWMPGEPFQAHSDAAMTQTTEEFYGKAGIQRDSLDWGVTFGKGTAIAKLDDVFASGTIHDEHQPGHLKIVKGDSVCVTCYEEKGAPCTIFCPAQVYEMHPNDKGQVSKVDIAFSNCVHCKTCDIKCPEENVIWTPPEGGGGPKWTVL
ncbi:MAG: 4Fe-4S dicluster domain-containing protein [Acidobacteria bacterium]|nr:4Fe-4S dicluster domain-containing protein [Acidobacteriota bacterium]